MDDISEKLAEILNDPESLTRVREMAENILGNKEKTVEKPLQENNIGSIFGDNFDPVQIGKIISIMSRLKNDCDDSRAKLLLALKPHLSAPKREKVDTAVKLLKLLDLLPVLRESGMLDF